MLLLVNDDGIEAEGLKVLEEYLRGEDVYVVAPLYEMSVSSHAFSLNQPLETKKIGDKKWWVKGTPADCVSLAIFSLLPKKPELIVSGINSSPNLGDDIIYSGTVAGAREGVILNIPAFAISLAAIGEPKEFYFSSAAQIALFFIDYLRKHPLPKGIFLNINVPNLPISEIEGIETTRQGRRGYIDNIRYDKDKQDKFFLKNNRSLAPISDMFSDTDFYAILNKKVSVTPLSIDNTAYDIIPQLNFTTWKEKLALITFPNK